MSVRQSQHASGLITGTILQLPVFTTLPDTPLPPPPGRKNREGGEETGQGETDEQREVTGQGRPRSPKTVQSADRGEGKEKRERSIVVVRSPCQILQMHCPARTSQCWSRQTQHGLGVCIWMHLVNSTGNSPSPGQPGATQQRVNCESLTPTPQLKGPNNKAWIASP